MKIGTKSLLFGAHQVILHPIFLALAWRKLYRSFPLDPRIWLAFVVHDWGYWGCPNMDGDEGKLHPWRTANWFAAWFDMSVTGVFEGSEEAALDRAQEAEEASLLRLPINRRRLAIHREVRSVAGVLGTWGRFCLFHSRSLARRYGEDVSKLCAPDKIAFFMMPRWLYLTGTRWSGELAEYMAEGDTPAGRDAGIDVSTPEAWFESVKLYLDGVAKTIVAGGDPGIPPTRSEAERTITDSAVASNPATPDTAELELPWPPTPADVGDRVLAWDQECWEVATLDWCWVWESVCFPVEGSPRWRPMPPAPAAEEIVPLGEGQDQALIELRDSQHRREADVVARGARVVDSARPDVTDALTGEAVSLSGVVSEILEEFRQLVEEVEGPAIRMLALFSGDNMERFLSKLDPVTEERLAAALDRRRAGKPETVGMGLAGGEVISMSRIADPGDES